jgi:DNA processing protein
MAAAARLGVRFIAMGEPDYPKTLQAIDTAPPLIALRGSSDVLAKPSVAIVGSRNASASGLTFAERLSRQLGEAGYVVVSGLARGIDTRAHKATLETGTVAVLAGGHVGSTPPRTNLFSRPSWSRAGRLCPRCPWAGNRGDAISRAATGSSQGCPMGSWWSKRRAVRAP